MMKKLCLVSMVLILGASLAFAAGGNQSSASKVEVVKLNIAEEPWLVPYDKPVTISIVNYASPQAKYEFPTDDETSNQWTRAYKKYLNVDIKTNWVSEDYATNLNLSIATGDLPDVFRANDVQFVQLMAANGLEDITDAYNKLSPRLKAVYDRESAILDVYRRNGRLYALQRLHYGYECDTGSIWIRKDWGEALGFTGEITSVDDLLNRVQTMNTRYKTKGMAIDKTLNTLMRLAPIYHAAPNIWVDGPNGSIVYGSVQPEMKTALAAFADWYKRGLLNPAFAEEDNAQITKDISAGLYGAYPGENWSGSWSADLVQLEGNKAYFEPFGLPSVDNKPVLYPVKFPSDGNYLVKKGSKVADAMIQCVNLYTFLQADARKYNVLTKEMQDLYQASEHVLPFGTSFAVYDPYFETQEYKRTGDESVLRSAAIFMDGIVMAREWLQTGKVAPENTGLMLMRLGQFYGNPRSAFGYNTAIFDRGGYLYSKLWGTTPLEVTRYGSTLDDLLLEGFTLIILGQQPVSYFDTLVRNWYSAGGQEVTDAINKAYRK
jgi:putative aldouronate transport system substrate-binding protein